MKASSPVTDDPVTSAVMDWIVTSGALGGTSICSPTWLPLCPFSVTAPACSLEATESPIAPPDEQVFDSTLLASVLMPYTDHPGETAGVPGAH